MSEEIERLRARLVEMVDSGRRTLGGGSVTSDGKVETWDNEPIMVPRNPDGAAALAQIDALTAERDGLREDCYRLHADKMALYTPKLDAECRATAAEAECARLVHVIERIRHIDDHAHVRPSEKSAREEMGHIARAALEAPRG